MVLPRGKCFDVVDDRWQSLATQALPAMTAIRACRPPFLHTQRVVVAESMEQGTRVELDYSLIQSATRSACPIY